MKHFDAVAAAAAFVFIATTAHAAGTCQPYEPGVTVLVANSGCYYATGPINDPGLVVSYGVVLNGTDADDTVGQVNGTFNGGGGADWYNLNYNGIAWSADQDDKACPQP